MTGGGWGLFGVWCKSVAPHQTDTPNLKFTKADASKLGLSDTSAIISMMVGFAANGNRSPRQNSQSFTQRLTEVLSGAHRKYRITLNNISTYNSAEHSNFLNSSLF